MQHDRFGVGADRAFFAEQRVVEFDLQGQDHGGSPAFGEEELVHLDPARRPGDVAVAVTSPPIPSSRPIPSRPPGTFWGGLISVLPSRGRNQRLRLQRAEGESPLERDRLYDRHVLGAHLEFSRGGVRDRADARRGLRAIEELGEFFLQLALDGQSRARARAEQRAQQAWRRGPRAGHGERPGAWDCASSSCLSPLPCRQTTTGLSRVLGGPPASRASHARPASHRGRPSPGPPATGLTRWYLAVNPLDTKGSRDARRARRGSRPEVTVCSVTGSLTAPPPVPRGDRGRGARRAGWPPAPPARPPPCGRALWTARAPRARGPWRWRRLLEGDRLALQRAGIAKVGGGRKFSRRPRPGRANRERRPAAPARAPGTAEAPRGRGLWATSRRDR